MNEKFKYKQIYRKAWEEIPEFKGWLKPVANDPNKAYCISCKKLLKAHRISLLKHTSTAKHQRIFEQKFCLNEKTEKKYNKTFDLIPRYCDIKESDLNPEQSYEITVVDGESNEEGMECILHETEENDLEVHDDNYKEDIEEECYQEEYNNDELGSEIVKMSKSPVSTHILDTSIGRPVSEVEISLYKLEEGHWTEITKCKTNTDGRATNLINKSNFTEGCYKIEFNVNEYFERRKIDTFFPFIEIVFKVTNCEEHYHVPLLLSPYGYSTYRGS